MRNVFFFVLKKREYEIGFGKYKVLLLISWEFEELEGVKLDEGMESEEYFR